MASASQSLTISAAGRDAANGIPESMSVWLAVGSQPGPRRCRASWPRQAAKAGVRAIEVDVLPRQGFGGGSSR